MLTFLSLAAPVPERMASIKACLAFIVLLRVPVLNLETVRESEGAWEAGGGAYQRVHHLSFSQHLTVCTGSMVWGGIQCPNP